MDSLPLTYRKLNTALELTFSQAEDSHFCDVTLIRLKSGTEVRSHYILLADVPQWIGWYERKGYKKKMAMTQAEKIKELTGAVMLTDVSVFERYSFLWTVIFN